MESKISNSEAPSKPASKRVFFDRRYGWVFDEWKDPSQEALSGGRGMFCILPLGTALLKTASQSINLAANTAVKVLERPNLLSPQEIPHHMPAIAPHVHIWRTVRHE